MGDHIAGVEQGSKPHRPRLLGGSYSGGAPRDGLVWQLPVKEPPRLLDKGVADVPLVAYIVRPANDEADVQPVVANLDLNLVGCLRPFLHWLQRGGAATAALRTFRVPLVVDRHDDYHSYLSMSSAPSITAEHRDVSRKSIVTAWCSCGWQGSRRVWTTVDATSRPELRQAASRGELGPLCPKCGSATQHGEPLVVVYRGNLPAIFFFGEDDASTASLASIPEDAAGGRHLAFALLPPSATSEILERDFDRDVQHEKRALREVRERAGVDAERRYRWLLGEIRWQHRVETLENRLNELLVTDDFERFQTIVRAEPGLKSRELRSKIERDVRDSDGDPRPELRLLLLDDLCHGARRAFVGSLPRRELLATELMESRTEIDARISAVADVDERLALIDAVLEGREGVTVDGAYRGHLLDIKGTAWIDRSGGTRQENLEGAIACYQEAVDLPTTSADEQAHRLGNLATAYGQRIAGDAATNRRIASGHLEEALETLEGSQDRALVATTQTNLALILRDNTGSDHGKLDRAHSLLRQALETRNPDADADDWVYTQTNLGLVLTDLAHRGRAAITEAEEAYREVLVHAHRIKQPWLVAQAEVNLAGILTASEEGDDEVEVPVDAQASDERRVRLVEATILLEDADRRARDRPDVQVRALKRLAATREELGLDSGPVLERALSLASSHGTADELAETASTYASLLVQRGDWEGACDAYRLALDGHDRAASAPFASADRDLVAQRRPQLARWAAHALLRIGAAREAATVLEGGRTQELRRRLGAEDREVADLQLVDSELAEQYLAAARGGGQCTALRQRPGVRRTPKRAA